MKDNKVNVDLIVPYIGEKYNIFIPVLRIRFHTRNQHRDRKYFYIQKWNYRYIPVLPIDR